MASKEQMLSRAHVRYRRHCKKQDLRGALWELMTIASLEAQLGTSPDGPNVGLDIKGMALVRLSKQLHEMNVEAMKDQLAEEGIDLTKADAKELGTWLQGLEHIPKTL